MDTLHKRIINLSALCCFFVLLSGCQTAYYSTMEQLGIHKRDILSDRVEEARDSQQDAKEQFKSALEQFSTLTNFDGGDLEDTYNRLNSEFEESEDAANAVHDRIAAVEDVAEALFDEWQAELDVYTNKNLRRSSEKKLRATKQKYGQLLTAMKRAEKKIDPVLSVFRDQVLFLKHNLNAQAISSLKSELRAVESDVASLVAAMEKSIGEADAFIQTLEK
ncbi:MAG: DUF2959 domain-containing protein [Gammaproteobacteria bacterium]|nr:MAG: DUF2959 domain-containing protein [Gammaproteobacteria bacterium]RLA20073.1 MAG: DUF2959 domain-containing protein [Gammaproteobacteria bacterium]